MPTWLIFALGTVCCWGAYGTAIHKSNVLLGHGMKTVLLVGVAYFFLAVLIPGIYIMSKQTIDWSFPSKGMMFGLLAGSLGAIGAICVTFAMRPESGGNPLFVMPIIFGCAPLVNVIVSSIAHPPKDFPSVFFFLGVLVLASGAGMVLYFQPR
jgi:drug/metabolite transporter (DMT)-like permease|tara:strand:+ start:178 stop:636 length:459 start_codon:yes stop_codon:yes gene_type:complete